MTLSFNQSRIVSTHCCMFGDFANLEEMVPQIAPYIADLSKLSELRIASRARVESQTYLNRARLLVNAIESLMQRFNIT